MTQVEKLDLYYLWMSTWAK